MQATGERGGLTGVRAEVNTVSWRAVSRHTEMTVWVKCSRGSRVWTLPLEVLPTLEILQLDLESDGAEPSSDVRSAAQRAASNYVAKNQTGLKEIFRNTH
jgi:hypothetical protein